MHDEEIRDTILEVGYKTAREKGSIIAGTFNVYEINSLTGVDKKDIDFNAEYLCGKGWMKWEVMGGGMRITTAGVSEYERTHG